MQVNDLPLQVVELIRQAIGEPPAALHEPSFGEAELDNLRSCIETTFVSSVGPFVTEFEDRVEEYCGAPFAVAVSSGTAALHVALLIAGVKPGDEVLVQALGFIATANAISYCGAIPHFVDIDVDDLGISPVALRDHLERVTVHRGGVTVNRVTGRPITAVVPMHTFGHVGQIDEILAVASEYNLVVIEDAAEAIGSRRNGQHAGTFAGLGVLSFNGNKTITTGGGGMLLLSEATAAQRARHLTTTARVAHRWHFDHDQVGFNYRMPNINAAIGCGQMQRLDSIVDLKRRLHERYAAVFSGVPEFHLLHEPEGCRSNYWLQTLILQESQMHLREQLLEATNTAGFHTRPAWKLLSDQTPYVAAPRADVAVARRKSQQIVNLPSSPTLVQRTL